VTGPKKEQSRPSAPPLPTTKQAHFAMGGKAGALERGECRVLHEGRANVLGALIANVVVLKTARVKQGAIMDVSAPPC
jgi:hypothetical protein